MDSINPCMQPKSSNCELVFCKMWPPNRKILCLIQICTIYISIKVTESQLTADSVSEGACVPNISRMAARNINFLFFAGSRNYYVPIASEACFRGYAEALLGRPVESMEELQSMKLRIRAVIPFPPTFVTYGFPDSKQIVQVCPPVGLTQVLCLPIQGSGSNGTDVSGVRTSLDTIYYTDNKSTILIVRCLNSKVKDYKVLTTRPTVNQETKATLLKKIQELGFKPELMQTLTY